MCHKSALIRKYTTYLTHKPLNYNVTSVNAQPLRFYMYVFKVGGTKRLGLDQSLRTFWEWAFRLVRSRS